MPNLSKYPLLASLALSLFASGAAMSDGEEPANEPVEQTSEVEAGDDTSKSGDKSRACIHVASINGFNPIDSKHLTVSVGANRTYLVTLRHRCTELKWSQKIAYDSTMSWSCTNTRDRILVKGDRCLIDTIEQVEDTSEAKELIESRENEDA